MGEEVKEKEPETREALRPVEALTQALVEEKAEEEKPAPSFEQLLGLAIADEYLQKPEYSGRYCNVCGDTTPHVRPRGEPPKYEKKVSWVCVPCVLPSGTLHRLVKRLMIRQGEIER